MKPNQGILQNKKIPHGGLFSVKNIPPGVIDFSSNINPFGPPKSVKSSMQKGMSSFAIYPDSNSENLKKKIQNYTKIPSSQIIVGNGATEIIYDFCKSFISKKIVSLIPIPTFGEYEVATKLNGGKILFYKTMNLNQNLSEFISKIPRKGCVFVCNPNNPTGILIPKKNMLKIVREAKKKSSLIFIDECFMELGTKTCESLILDIKNFDNLFILRSLTKSFGLAGLRIGYGLTNKKIALIIKRAQIPWNVSGIAQIIGEKAILDKPYLRKTQKLIQKESTFLRKQISKIPGFECNKTDTNFILIKTKLNSRLVQKKLLKRKILVRDCSSFTGLGQNFIRVAIKKRADNKKLINSLMQI